MCQGRKGSDVGNAACRGFACGGVLNVGKSTGHDVLASVVVQVDGDRSAVLKTPFLRDKLGVVRSRRGKRRADNGVIEHHEAVAAQLHRADVHQSGMNGLLAVVGMKDDAQDAVLIVEERVMARADEVVPTAKDGVLRVLRPVARCDVVRIGITHGIVLALIVVARIGEEISTAMFDDVWPLVDAPHLVLPTLRDSETFAQGSCDGRNEVVAQLCLPDAVAVGEAHEEDVGRAVRIDEDMRVDALLVADEVVHLVRADLHERAFRRVGSRGIEVLVGGVVHDVLAFDVIDLRSPEPFGFCRVVFMEGQAFVLPDAQVVARIAADAVGIVSAVGVVGVAFEQDVRVSQRHLALPSLCQSEEREEEERAESE